jgi:hypothetical protein
LIWIGGTVSVAGRAAIFGWLTTLAEESGIVKGGWVI